MNSARDLGLLEELLEAMLQDNDDITARAVTRRIGSPFKHASDITRNPDRARLVDQYRAKQAGLRSLMEKSDKQSKTNLTHRISRLEEALALAFAQRDLLIASHRAMLLAVGETGGMAAWKRFFSQWEEAQEKLSRLGALPTAEVLSLPVTRSGQAIDEP